MHTQLNADSTADQVLAGTSLKGKRYLVTGVASGIGRATARALVARGATVVGTVKDSATAEARIAAVRQAAIDAGGALELLELELASLHRVRTGADALLAAALPFDAVIANAGVMATPFTLTDDGFESQFAIN